MLLLRHLIAVAFVASFVDFADRATIEDLCQRKDLAHVVDFFLGGAPNLQGTEPTAHLPQVERVPAFVAVVVAASAKLLLVPQNVAAALLLAPQARLATILQRSLATPTSKTSLVERGIAIFATNALQSRYFWQL